MKKSPLEKILLVLLFLLALPFILVFVGIFIVVYILGFLIEGSFYFRSKYYQTFKEKYFLFVTRTKSYQKFNIVTKDSEVTFLDNLVITDATNYFLVQFTKELTHNKELSQWEHNNKEIIKYIKNKYQTNKEILLIVKKEQFTKDDYLLAKKADLFIFID